MNLSYEEASLNPNHYTPFRRPPPMPFRSAKTVFFIILLVLLAVPAMGLVEPGRITVYSTPSGARACIDNVDCDTTGATFTAKGNAWHTVVVTENGYLQWSDYVYVTSGQTSVVNAFLDLNPAVTAIQVYVKPGGGTVCLDNTDCRVNVGTPGSTGSTQFSGVNEGYHTISVESPAGYDDATQVVSVTLGKFTTVNIVLDPVETPVTGTVQVYVDRTGTTICIDNGDCHESVGGTDGPGTGTAVFNDITADEVHTISVAADGYEPYSTQITVLPEQVNEADVTLQPLPPESADPTPIIPEPPSLPTTRAGLDAIPVIGAIFLCSVIVLCRNNKE
jgi:hypothetical protein